MPDDEIVARVRAEWNALDDLETSPVKTIAAKLQISTAEVAAIVYPPEQFGEWDDSQEPMPVDLTTTWDEVDDLLDRYDAEIEINCGSGAAWAGELRLTLTNPPTAPSRSVTFYSVGHAEPEAVARALLADAAVWRHESGVEPMPVPDWMR